MHRAGGMVCGDGWQKDPGLGWTERLRKDGGFKILFQGSSSLEKISRVREEELGGYDCGQK